jgi:hypothetical protein
MKQSTPGKTGFASPERCDARTSTPGQPVQRLDHALDLAPRSQPGAADVKTPRAAHRLFGAGL